MDKNSNHPPTVTKQIHKALSKQITDIFSSKNICDQNISYYEDALKHSVYDNFSLPYSPTQDQGHDKIEKEHRKRRAIWFNTPFSLNVKPNVVKDFYNFYGVTSQSDILCAKYSTVIQLK